MDEEIQSQPYINMTNEKEMGIPETTLLYMARDWAKWAQDNFNAYKGKR